MGVDWVKIEDATPSNNSKHDIDVIVKIEGFSMNASEYEEYRIVKWRKSCNCFIEWVNGESITYNDNKGNTLKPVVVAWAYFNKYDD